ncbi:Probable ubiquitin-conjugating enzyme E2 33 [Seminavis robusta]|uniref:Probable ubiquitin-conjugating enzyme E2 33 n=1 Tax=Seminavis robusta TaxID=568900 RepID=A0A9N8H9P9_9STRA|nr:Probable ubiquitin-conjugating enzyme E2 33 [Seminavis robusta]|eukprot:Sro199_g084410.1 Probable ubiquitin-conjugating enzyme E2 33 (342) ;mRNA; f:56054-57435
MSKSPSLRRIQADIRELALDPSDRYHAAPLEHDMFEWHFTIRGADGTDFEGGVYHGRIMLPPEYPFKPPHIIFLTPSGRFETNTKVCLSFSAYHPELWQPAWGIRLILEALISFLPTPADGAIGALDWTGDERKRLAVKSVHYHCPTCGCKAIELLPKLKPKTDTSDSSKNDKPKSKFQKEIEKLQQFQAMEHGEDKDINDNNNKGKDGEEKDPKAKEEVPKEEPKPSVETSVEATTTTTNTNDETEPPTEQAPAVVTPTAAAPQQQQPVEQMQDPPMVQLQQQQQQQQLEFRQEDGMLSWMVDPVLHGIIVILAVLCFLLMRKLQTMMEELEELNAVLEG